MQLICEGHPQISGISHGMQLVLNKPTILEDGDVLTGDELGFAVRWRGSAELPAMDAAETLTARVEMDRGTLFAFDFKRGRAAPSSH